MEFNFKLQPGKDLVKEPIKDIIEPKVSIITAYYNTNPEYFKQLFNCIINQTFPYFEWIIVNDGSTNEESIKALRDIEKIDSRIRVLDKENGGIASARNLGIKNSASSFIVPLDSDDLIENNYLEILYFALYYNEEYTWAYTDTVGFQEQEYTWIKDFDPNLLKTHNFLVATSMIKKEAIEEVGYFNETIKYLYEDWDLWLKFLEKGKKPIKLDELGFWYRRTDSGVLGTIENNEKNKKIAEVTLNNTRFSGEFNIQAKLFRGDFIRDKFSIPSKFKKVLEYKPIKNNKINILFIIPWMSLGGADLFNLNFTKLIDKSIYHITIVTTHKSDNAWKQRFREHVDDIVCLPDFLDSDKWGEFISYLIENRSINICMVSNSYFGYSLIPWIKENYSNIKIIDYVHMEELYWRDGGYARISATNTNFIDRTYVCNNSTRKYMLNNYIVDKDKIKTIYIGVDKCEFDSNNIEKGNIRRELKLKEDDKIVLFPCRLNNQKRPSLMIEIAKEIVKKRSNVKFIVVGSGLEEYRLKNLTKTYGLEDKVLFVGEKKDMRPYYKEAYLTLICSIKEGLSLTAYESCSMSIPVITSDVGGQAELIDSTVGRVIPLLQKDTDINLFEYSKKEINLYVDAVNELLDKSEEDYAKIANSCRKRIEDKFSIDIMIKLMEKELREVLNEEVSISEKNKLESITKEYAAMYCAYESREQEAQRLWNDFVWANNERQNFQNEYYNIKNSTAYKVGRFITCIPRKVKTIIKYNRENGAKETLNLLLSKLR